MGEDFNVIINKAEELENVKDGFEHVVCSNGGQDENVSPALHDLSSKDEARADQSEKAVEVVVTRQNGYREDHASQVLLHSSFSQCALHFSNHRDALLSQSDYFSISTGQWRFSNFIPYVSRFSKAVRVWLRPCSSFSPSMMLSLSVVAIEMLTSDRGGAYWQPLQPLKDWTFPPSVDSDHCYLRTSTLSSFSAHQQYKHRTSRKARSFHLPRRRPLPLPPCSSNRSAPVFPSTDQSAGSVKTEWGKRVSQIRIRRATPRETPLTPMGLPKVKRLKKKDFSLEEIYTNKNYKCPPANSLETIFEEPREKDGALLLIGQQRRRRVLLFPDFTQPRKRRKQQGAGLPVAMVPRKRAAVRRNSYSSGNDDDANIDVMLLERLSELDDFLTQQGLDV
ncbi:uncharacterized protein wu:fi75a02 isoform X2 [Thalassophryne amazonica]|uniref:uncharacterized protein wu:fi75a02 isoform X2 n=1 Tax=Thalassophryne amazonica TaxID=390379 RepID=UPI0014710D99|nr:uncharacterized protein wu:fi75a02 isoform X2 [Thalassophryne amazonica]